MSSDFPPLPPPPPKPPVPAATPPPPPPPASLAPGPASVTTGPGVLDEVPPLTFSLTPFPPPPPPVAPPPPAPPTPPPPSRLSSGRRIIAVTTIALLLLIAGATTWSHLRNRLSEADLLAWLGTQTQGQVVFNEVTRTVVPQSDGSRIVKFDAHGTVPAALYTPENTASYLRRTLDLSPALPAAVNAASEAAADLAVRKRAGISDTVVAPLAAVVLRETTPAGTPYAFSGVATARRADGAWRFTLLQGTFTQKIPEGQPRATFGEKTYVAGNPADDESLRQLVARQNETIALLEKASTELAEENKRDRESRLARFHTLLAAGSLFTGQAALANNGQRESVSLEIVAARPGSHQVSAVLRNASGWTDARPFLGTWKLDDASGVFSLNLMTRSGQAIVDAGPILDAKDALTLAFVLAEDGQLTSTTESDLSFEARRVASSELAAIRSQLTAHLDAAIEATRVDTLYHGTATAKSGGASEHVFLRFTKQAAQGAAIAASFESAEAGASWNRPLHGTIIDNRHRAGDEPIRLQMPGRGRTRSAPPGTLFAYASDTAPVFKIIDGTQLRGEDAAFTYEFTRVTAAQAVLLKKAVESSSATPVANYPRTSGVHAQIDGQWLTLPRNGGSTSQGFAGIARSLFSRTKDADKPALLVFKGSTPPPALPGEALTLTFKGKIPVRAKGVSADYPPIEAARTAPQEDGTRAAPLERITSSFSGFGENRLAATVLQPADDLLTIAFQQTLAPGTYAVLVGTDGYEFTVE